MHHRQFALAVLVIVFAGCGPSKEEQALEAFLKGNAWQEKGEHDKAIADYTEVIRVNAKTDYDLIYYAYIFRAVSWEEKGEFDNAIADCTKAIRLKPKEHSAYLGRGGAWEKKGYKAKAEADYKKVEELGFYVPRS